VLEGKTLLIICPSYPNEDDSLIANNFIKYQVEELKYFFEKIIVIAPVYQSYGFLKKDKLSKDYCYDNVYVYYPRCYYIPIFWLSKIIIDNRLKVVDGIIKSKNLHFDIIHAHFTWPSGYIGVKLKEKYRTPLVITIHENGDWLDQELIMYHPLINIAWSGADALIRVNSKDVPILKHYNKQTYGIPNGFSPAFHPIDIHVAREKLSLEKDKKIIFSIGYLVKRKGFNYLIKAISHVCSQRDDVICFIGGMGHEKKALQSQIVRLHLEDKVKLLGFIPEGQLNLWMNACDLFVLPSLNEGNPTVMFEALGCGKPFVGTKVGGVPEVITSDEYGLLIEPGDSEGLSKRIIVALDKEWDRKAIVRYAEQYTWKRIAEEITRVYEQVLHHS